MESNIQNHKEMEEELNMTKTMLNKKNNIKVNINNSNLTESKNMNNENIEASKNNNYMEMEGKGEEIGTENNLKNSKEINQLNEKVRRYKSEVKINKEKANKDLAELNKIYLEKNKLENIFNDCVNATKKIIYNRKLKENKSYKIKNKTGLGKYDYKINLTTKYEEFLPGDKQSTLENFLFNEEVYNIVKDAIFKHPNTRNKKNENAKKLSDYNFYDPDWKMKEIIENASSDLSKNENFLPLMSVGNKMKNTFNKESNNLQLQNKDKMNNQFYKTGKITMMNPFIINKQKLVTSSKLTMNLQV